jgi:hypothetical protein
MSLKSPDSETYQTEVTMTALTIILRKPVLCAAGEKP